MAGEWMSVAQAAALLQVSDRRVRELAESGTLTADRVGGTWLVDAQAARSRAARAPLAGRPLSPRLAWLMLAVVQAKLDGDVGGAADGRIVPPNVVADRQAKHRVRRLMAERVHVRRWESWLAGRAQRRRVWVHPGLLDHLASDDRVHAGGATAAAALGIGVSGGAVRRFYISSDLVDDVVAQFRLVGDPTGPVELMVVPAGELASSAGLAMRSGAVAPAVALADLLESDDARERDAAAAKLVQLALASR